MAENKTPVDKTGLAGAEATIDQWEASDDGKKWIKEHKSVKEEPHEVVDEKRDSTPDRPTTTAAETTPDPDAFPAADEAPANAKASKSSKK